MPIRVGFDTTTNKELFKKLIEEIFDTCDRPALVEYKEVYKDKKISEEYIRLLRMGGFTAAGEVGEGVNIPTDIPKLGTTKEFTPVRYGLGFRVTDRFERFNKWQLVEDFTKKLKVVMQETKDIEVAKLWNSPTSTTWVGFDSLALLSSSHTTLKDASTTTYDNYVSAALSVTSLQDAIIYFDTIIDDMGMADPQTPNRLVIPPQLRMTAGELLKSDGKPHELSNTINLFPDFDLKIFVYHRLTDTNNWFLLNTKHEDYGPRVYTATEPDIKVQDAPDTSRDKIITSQQYFTYGFTDARQVYGSTPS